MTDKDYSLDALNTFFDKAAQRGDLNRNTAQSRKIAANKILSLLDDHDKADLRSVDIDRAFQRFMTLQGGEYKQDSLQVYLSRVRTAVTDFVSYTDDPLTFKPSGSKRSSRGKSNKDSNGNGGKEKATRNNSGGNTGSDDKPPREDPPTHGVTVPVQLREDLLIKISNVPSDLTPAEANRLAAIIKAYAMTEE
jgi:hypothetical protein